MSELQRYKLILEYVGTDFKGWQWQRDLPSIQQSLEDAIYGFSHQHVRAHSAGRTDAGVHARGQVAHVDFAPFKKPMSGFEIAKAINAYLRPAPIAVVDAQPVAEDFHARFSAKNKLYHYRIINRPALLAIDKGMAWHFKRPLDSDAMHKAAQYLLGKHDFTTFRDSQCQAQSPIRSVDRLDVIRDGDEILIAAEGKSFLHHQVRNMVGTLVLVGEGKWQPEAIKDALLACDRTKGGPTAPSDGLYLMRVDYA